MFKVRDLSFRYPGSDAKALDGVNLDLMAGTTTAVLGLSGSGKTTLLNLLGLLWDKDVDADTLVYTDRQGRPRDYRDHSVHDWNAVRLYEFGFVMQSAHMLPHFSCGENVAMPLVLQGVPARVARRRVRRLLSEADPSGELDELHDRRASDVSGGQRQRMAVLRALVHNPRIVFADEPLSNLDPLNARRTLDLLLRWKDGAFGPTDGGRCLVLVTHDVHLARQYADQFLILAAHFSGAVSLAREELDPAEGEKQLLVRMGCSRAPEEACA